MVPAKQQSSSQVSPHFGGGSPGPGVRHQQILDGLPRCPSTKSNLEREHLLFTDDLFHDVYWHSLFILILFHVPVNDWFSHCQVGVPEGHAIRETRLPRPWLFLPWRFTQRASPSPNKSKQVQTPCPAGDTVHLFQPDPGRYQWWNESISSNFASETAGDSSVALVHNSKTAGSGNEIWSASANRTKVGDFVKQMSNND